MLWDAVLPFLLLGCATCLIVGASHHTSIEERLTALRHRAGGCLATPSSSSNSHHKRGIVFCAGDRMVPDVFRTVYQFRHMWNSTLPMVVAHCAEISAENQGRIRRSDPCVSVLDVCVKGADGRVFGMAEKAGLSRLRSFYCKVAALYHSPFAETMVADMDTVWLKPPDVVFNYEGYRTTGALFFRDQVHVQDPARPPGLDRPQPDVLRLFLKSKNVAVDEASAVQRIAANASTYSLFWRYIARTGRYLNDYQDSSVVVMHKPSHNRTLEVLRDIIAVGYLGYGDKELFWLAATIAGEPYAFEPFMAAYYGDCTSVILHYDPNDAALPLAEARPLYINAEHMVEVKSLEAVGLWLRSDISLPVKVHGKVALNDSELDMARAGAMNKSSAWSEAKGCNCLLVRCTATPPEMNLLLTAMQWLTLGLHPPQYPHLPPPYLHIAPDAALPPGPALAPHPPHPAPPPVSASAQGRHGADGTRNGTHEGRACVPVAWFAAAGVRAVQEQLMDRRECAFAGCASVTHAPDLTLAWRARDIYCDPVAFYPGSKPPPALREWAIHARVPTTPMNNVTVADGQLIRCGWEDAVYLVVKDELREMVNTPNDDETKTATRKASVRHLPRYLCDKLKFGHPLPKDRTLFSKLLTFLRQSRSNFIFYARNKMPMDLV